MLNNTKTTTCDVTPRVYVGTYAKYAGGSIAGDWLNLEDYDTEAAFYAACKELHKDESDPELMFQDFEGIPSDWYGECSIDKKVWEWLELDGDDREKVIALIGSRGAHYLKDLQEMIDEYIVCHVERFEEFVEELAYDTFPEIAEGGLGCYFDFDLYEVDCRIDYDYCEETGYVVRRHT